MNLEGNHIKYYHFLNLQLKVYSLKQKRDKAISFGFIHVINGTKLFCQKFFFHLYFQKQNGYQQRKYNEIDHLG